MRSIVILCCCALLAACGSVATRPASTGGGDIARGGDAPAPAKRGGYYKDDGPGENPPPDLARIPDAEPRAEPLSKRANEPYTALGQTYRPAKSVKDFRQRGVASWYGKMFHGRKTSSGEVYDMYAMSAAHPTLPIPSYARVTNVANGQSVVVRVNDRGPFHPGRVMDLSYAAANKLGYINRGHTEVQIESIVIDPKTGAELARADAPRPAPAAAARGNDKRVALARADAEKPAAATAVSASASSIASPNPEPANTAAATPPAEAAPAASAGIMPVALNASAEPARAQAEPGGFFVQLGAFRTSDKAEEFRRAVAREAAWVADRLMISVQNGMYRLHVGPYASTEDARDIASRMGELLKLRPLVIQR